LNLFGFIGIFGKAKSSQILAFAHGSEFCLASMINPYFVFVLMMGSGCGCGLGGGVQIFS